MNPLISIIVPVFNAEKYLGSCLDSVLSQTYRNLEILVIDDGSTDHSPEICDEYMEKDARVLVIHQNNRGAAAARNAGLKACRGSFIGFADADDVAAPEYVECLYRAAEESGAGIARCEYLRFRGEKNPFRPEAGSGKEPEAGSVRKPESSAGTKKEAGSVRWSVCPGKEIVMRMIAESRETAVWTGLYRREVLEGIFFEEGRLFEDVMFSCRAYMHTETALLSGRKLYAYREKGSGTGGSSREAPLKMLDALTVREQRIAYLEENAPELADPARLELSAEILQRYAGLDKNEENAPVIRELMRWREKYPYTVRSIRGSGLRAPTRLALTGAKLSFKGSAAAIRILKKFRKRGKETGS